jgi:hypothetical protein
VRLDDRGDLEFGRCHAVVVGAELWKTLVAGTRFCVHSLSRVCELQWYVEPIDHRGAPDLNSPRKSEGP